MHCQGHSPQINGLGRPHLAAVGVLLIPNGRCKRLLCLLLPVGFSAVTKPLHPRIRFHSGNIPFPGAWCVESKLTWPTPSSSRPGLPLRPPLKRLLPPAPPEREGEWGVKGRGIHILVRGRKRGLLSRLYCRMHLFVLCNVTEFVTGDKLCIHKVL